MKNLQNIEVFNIETTDEGLFAWISFQYLENRNDLNGGFNHIRVPIKPRKIQYSVRNNILVDQGEKS